jgi:RNA polymerase sigma-70 factor (ECF subfamily)
MAALLVMQRNQGVANKKDKGAGCMRDINDHQSDADLIAKIAGKDRNAFRCLSDRYTKLLFSAAYRLGVDQGQAEDIVQETMLRVWQKAEQWSPEKGAAVKTWLYRIAYNQAVDAKRKEKYTVAVEEQDLAAPELTDKNIEDVQRKKFVRQAIEGLPERQRRALVLCHYQGLSNAEAAEIMGATVKAVEALLVRARKDLYESLKTKQAIL